MGSVLMTTLPECVAKYVVSREGQYLDGDGREGVFEWWNQETQAECDKIRRR